MTRLALSKKAASDSKWRIAPDAEYIRTDRRTVAGSRPIFLQRASNTATRASSSTHWASKLLAKLMVFHTSACRAACPSITRTQGGDDQWWARDLNRTWAQRRAVDPVVAPLVRNLRFGEQEGDNFDVLAESGDPFLRAPVLDAHHLVRRIDVEAGAETNIQPTARYVIGGQGLKSEQRRISKGDLCD
jgi:hypothetical protein